MGMAADEDVALRTWEREQPDAITKDPLWTLNCYREALFLVDVARADAHRLGEHPALVGSKGQLLTSVASVAANIAEGYGRMSAADRAKFLSYALGSAREAITWYRAVVPPTGDPQSPSASNALRASAECLSAYSSVQANRAAEGGLSESLCVRPS